MAHPDYDVIIVGAGPAGATAAKCLLDLRPDTQVLLLDKAKQFPRKKPCGGYLGAEVLELFPYLKGKEGYFVESESRQGILHSPDLRYRVSGRTRMLGVLRETFDAYLVGLAKQVGAQFGMSSRVIDVKHEFDYMSLSLSDGRHLTTRLVIGADGASSVVARRSKLHPGWLPHEICRTMVKEFPVNSEYIVDKYGPDRPVHLFLKFNQIPGYAWVFPKAHHINVGLGCFANYPIRLVDYFRVLLRILKAREMLPKSANIRGVEAGICPTMGPILKTQIDRLLLIGDAAGFVSPSTGAGIVPGMQSGQLAAQTFAEALDCGRFDSNFLQRYQIRWEQVIGRFTTEKLIQKAFLTRFCNLFIRIGEQDSGIREFVSKAQSKDPMGIYGRGMSVFELLLRVIWALIKAPFGHL
ncbi:MAG: NAD(P)/FAD-dependent oxidoreductase [Candidatus Thorarchaeota archaeon]